MINLKKLNQKSWIVQDAIQQLDEYQEDDDQDFNLGYEY